MSSGRPDTPTQPLIDEQSREALELASRVSRRLQQPDEPARRPRPALRTPPPEAPKR